MKGQAELFEDRNELFVFLTMAAMFILGLLYFVMLYGEITGSKGSFVVVYQLFLILTSLITAFGFLLNVLFLDKLAKKL